MIYRNSQVANFVDIKGKYVDTAISTYHLDVMLVF